MEGTTCQHDEARTTSSGCTVVLPWMVPAGVELAHRLQLLRPLGQQHIQVHDTGLQQNPPMSVRWVQWEVQEENVGPGCSPCLTLPTPHAFTTACSPEFRLHHQSQKEHTCTHSPNQLPPAEGMPAPQNEPLLYLA